MLATDSSSHQITALIFNGLVKYDENIQLVGDLAERWQVEDGGLKIIFFLRKNVRWQDGVPFTAADVVFTYEKLIDPELPTPYGADFEKVKSVRAIDDWTVEVLYKEPFVPALASWGMGMLPKHLLQHENLLKTSFSRHPIGTGPYRFREWKTAEFVDLEANTDYFDGEPSIGRYLYRIIPDQTTAFIELQSGSIDMASLTPLQYYRQTDTPFFKKRFKKFQYPSFGYLYMGYNLQNPLFQQARIRYRKASCPRA